MGAKYSSGNYPAGFKDGLLKNIDINTVRLKVYTFEKIKRGRLSRYNDLFISQSEVQYMFGFTPRQCHEFFQLLDHEQLRRIPVYDLWGCLTLACTNSANEKVEFLFEILDANKDGYVSKCDLENMFVCATRGFARLKGISPPLVANLKDLTNKALHSKSTILNENGEIAAIDLKVFMMSSDTCRKYFSNLGSNVEMKDENKLLQQREEMLHELLEVEYQMKELMLSESIREEDLAMYTKERGGDEQLVRISESQLARLGTLEDKTNEDFDNIRQALTAKIDLKAQALEDQYNRRAHRDNSSAVEAVRLKDAVAFSAGRHCKPAPNNDHASNVSDQAFIFRWNKLAQDADGLTSLDIDIIEDLFEASGVLMTDADAQLCLNSIKPNQLGRYAIEDVMSWHRDFVLWGAVRKPLFREVAEAATASINSVGKTLSEVLEVLGTHKAYAAHCAEIKAKLKSIEAKIEAMNAPPKTAEELEIEAEMEEERRRSRPQTREPSGAPAASGEDGKTKPGFQLNLTKEQLMGSVRLAAWQRQQVLNPPSRVELKATFGMYTDQPTGVQRASMTQPEYSASTKKKAIGGFSTKSQTGQSGDKSSPSSPVKSSPPSKTGNKKAALAKAFVKSPKKENKADSTTIPHWKMNFKFQFTVKPLMDSRAHKSTSNHFIDEDEYLLKNVYDFNSSDLLDHFTYSFTGLLGEMTKSYGTASWVLFEVSPQATDEEAALLNVCCRNFFESIPFQERQSYYTAVRSKLLTAKWEPGNEMSFSMPSLSESPGSTTSKKPAPPARMEGLQNLWKTSTGSEDDPVDSNGFPIQRVVLVVLLHEEDVFRKLEHNLPPGVLMTRSIREATIDVNLRNNLAELYQLCFPYEHFRDRLFGPQEDELGEDGMNPLRYAKMCRKRQAAAQELIDKAPDMPFEDLRYHCRVRGLNDSGSKGDLVLRVQDAFKRQLDILGFGELSAFGEDICKKIYNMYRGTNSTEDGGLSLWELNTMLYESGCEKAIYDLNEYRGMLGEHHFRCDRQGRLLPEGLTAYFEKFGRLGDAMQALAVGSLDEYLAGALDVLVDFDNEGFSSMVDMFSTNTVSEWTLKSIVRMLSCLQDISVNSDYLRPTHLLDALKSLLQKSGLLGDEGAAWGRLLEELFASIEQSLKTPGWLVSKLHRLLEDMANGDNGIIRSLRIFLMTEFSSFASWEGKFREHLRAWRKLNAASSSTGSVSTGATTPFAQTARVDDVMDALNQPATARISTARSGLIVETDLKPREEMSSVKSAGGDTTSTKNLGGDNRIAQKEEHIQKMLAEAAAAKDAEAAKQYEEEAEKTRIEGRHVEVKRLEEFLQKCLPELQSSTHLTEKRFEELMAKAKRVKDLLANENIHLNRAEREELRLASGSIEAEALQLRSDLEHCKAVSAAHACALYDAVRLYSRGITSIGWGTKEICAKATSKGFYWADLLPRAEGELSIPLQIRENKLRRAAQRKNAALAALEREQQRRKLDDVEKEKLRQENEVKRDRREEEEERLLFAEAFDLYCIAKEERQLLPTLESLASMWEKLATMKTARYPKSLQAIVCQNNFACICLQFFGRNSARWQDAAVNLDACSDLLFLFLEETHFKAEEESRKQKEQEMLSVAHSRADDEASSISGSVGMSGSRGGGRVAFSGVSIADVKAGQDISPLGTPSARSQRSQRSLAASPVTAVAINDAAAMSTEAVTIEAMVGSADALEGEAYEQNYAIEQSNEAAAVEEIRGNSFPHRVLGVQEAMISPIVMILQNHINYLRAIAPADLDGNPRYEELTYKQRRMIDDNQSLVVALLEQLGESERERVFNGVARGVNHIPVFVYAPSGSGNYNHSSATVAANVSAHLERTVTENEIKIETALKRAIDEKARRLEEERLAAEHAIQQSIEEAEKARKERELKLAMAAADDSTASNTLCELALARDEKAKRYQKQRELDNLVRERVSKHRNKLYSMIRTDEISKVFKSHAKSVEHSVDYAVNWGQSQDEMLQSDAFQTARRPGASARDK
jgi:hypothetical protein